MHLNLPPFFVLVTAANQAIFGSSWLASKLPALLQLVGYTCGLYLVSLYIPARAWTRALLLSAAFLMSIAASFARFDDYHVPTYITIVYSAWLLLRYHFDKRPRQEWVLSVLLGVLSGISLANRLNDGGTLLAAVCILLPLFVRRRRLAATGIFIATSATTLLVIVLATGDTVAAWANDSIFRAAAIKGGGHILLYPLVSPLRQAQLLQHDKYQLSLLLVFFLATSIVAYVLWYRDRTRSWVNWRTGLGLLLVLGLFAWKSRWLGANGMSLAVGLFGFIIGTVFTLVVVVRTVREGLSTPGTPFHAVPLLLLLPLFQALGAATTAAKASPEYTPSVGILLLLLPISVPAFASGLPEVALASVAAVLTGYGLPMKAFNPYAWQHYIEPPLFADRQWYRHPQYGPMYLTRSNLRLMQDFCDPIQKAGTSTELLSLPFPYPNYFCAVKPWHGYVQTWYDTSSAPTILQLTHDLESAPPEWIVYQRGLDTMGLHERVLQLDHPLPQRALDQLIADRVQSGAWSVLKQRCVGGSDWILIHTRPAGEGEQAEMLIPSSDHVNLCSRTDVGFLH